MMIAISSSVPAITSSHFCALLCALKSNIVIPTFAAIGAPDECIRSWRYCTPYLTPRPPSREEGGARLSRRHERLMEGHGNSHEPPPSSREGGCPLGGGGG